MSKLRFLPVLMCATIGRTLAAEAVAIAMEAPIANTRDIQNFINGKTGGVKLGGKRTQRRRPPSWRRRQSKPWGSIWETK
eukprot:3125562-Heterocapsa_arctica.AAC.1